jgi:uncharacterized surface protein with fasciclin (FAS1) repeats
MKKYTIIFMAAAFMAVPILPLKADCGASHGSDMKKAVHSHAEKAGDMKAEAMDIVDTAVSAGSFETLVTAVKAAGLVDLLKGDGPFTVFAPNDAAFAKLPEGAVAGLLKDKDALTKVLTYHVVPGKVTAADVVGLNKAKTAQGQSLPIAVDGESVMVGGAKVIATDILASNGVIHVVDSVMMPQ